MSEAPALIKAGRVAERTEIPPLRSPPQPQAGLAARAEVVPRRPRSAAFYGPGGHREPWDPRAVSDPQMVMDEFPDQLKELQPTSVPGPS